MASVLLAHGAAGLALFLACAELWVAAVGLALILVSLGLAWRAEALKGGLVLCLMADGGVVLIHGGESPSVVSAPKAAVAFRHAVWLTLDVPRTDSHRSRRLHLMLLSSHLRCRQWRALQVWTRHRLPAATNVAA